MNNRITALLLTWLAGGAVAQTEGTSAFVDGIVAVVNEGVVLQSELDDEREAILARLTDVELPPRDVLNQQILERLILTRLQLQRADRMGVQISDEMLNRGISAVAAENGITIDQLPAALAATGIDYTRYRDEMRQQMTLQQLRQIDVVSRIAVSEREIEQCLIQQEGRVNVNAEYDIAHILIGVPGSATNQQYAEAEAEANDIIEQLQGGKSFGELAVSFSDAQTALDGGALGWRRGDQVPTLFAGSLATMKPGDVSAPIRSPSGFHIVRLNDVRGLVGRSEVKQSKIRHILVSTNEIIDDQTARQRLEEAREDILNGEDFAELARLISDDPGSATEGGEMGWTNPGTFVPEFEQMADSLDIGAVSEPFRTRFGWHILQVQERRVYDNTEEMRERNCASAIRNSRVEEETEIWLRRLRDDAFVDIRIG